MDQAAVVSVMAVIAWAQEQIARYGRVGCTKIMKVPDLAAAIAAPVGTVQPAPQLTFRDDGWVIALYGQELAGTVAAFAGLGVRVQFPGDIDLVSNGNAGDFAPLLSLVGPNVNWFAMTRRVTRGDNWNVTYKNNTGALATPTIEFAFIADDDIPRMHAQMVADQARRAAGG